MRLDLLVDFYTTINLTIYGIKLRKTVLFIIALTALTGVTSFTTIHVYAHGSHSEADSTSIAAVVMMTTDSQEMLYSAL